MENKNYGLKFDKPSPEHCVFGKSSIPFEILQPNGNWNDWLPVKEFQSKTGLETYACVIYTILNCVEILIKRKYGIERNYSDRFLACALNTAEKGGASPQEACEFLRKIGVPPEDVYPFDDSIVTVQQYFANLPPVLYEIAKEFNKEWDLKHEFVPLVNKLISEALISSPLLFTVYAWVLNEKNLYYRPEGQVDVHATTLISEKVGEYRTVFDTYDGPCIKDYDWNSMPMIVKRFHIEKKETINIEPPKEPKISFWDWLKSLLRSIFKTHVPV